MNRQSLIRSGFEEAGMLTLATDNDSAAFLVVDFY